MNPVWTIAKRELGSFFDSLVAYLLLVAFLAFSGIMTWLAGNDIFYRGQADLLVFFYNAAYYSLFLFIPALTMRMMAEEKRAGTIELLLTKSISNRQLVVGKFVACFLLLAIGILFTLPYYSTVSYLGEVDHGAILCGYCGLLLMSAAYIAIGLFASSLTGNQIVAFLVSLVIGGPFFWIFRFIGSYGSGFFASVFTYLDFFGHYESIVRGVLDSKDLVFFLSVTALALLLAELQIARRG